MTHKLDRCAHDRYGYEGCEECAVAELRAENDRLRAALLQFVAVCDTAPPTSLIIEIGMACEAAKAALR